jgi:hypothetical protein
MAWCEANSAHFLFGLSKNDPGAKSAGRRPRPSIVRVPCSTVWRSAARHRSRPRSRALAVPRTGGSALAARGQPVDLHQWPSGSDWIHEIKHDGYRRNSWRLRWNKAATGALSSNRDVKAEGRFPTGRGPCTSSAPRTARSNQVSADACGRSRRIFAEVLLMPLPGRLAALVRCLNADGNEMPEGEPGHGATTTEAPNHIDRRGRR